MTTSRSALENFAALGPPPSPFVRRMAELCLFIGLLFALGVLTPNLRPDVAAGRAPTENVSSAFNVGLWLALGGICAALIATAPRRFMAALPMALPLLILCAYILASAAWALVPDVAFRRGILFFIVTIVIGTGVLYSENPKRVLLIAYLAFFIAMLANLAVLPVANAWHTRALESGLYKGIAGHKNMVGNMALLALMVGSVCWRARAALLEKSLWFVFMGGWAVLLYLSGSKTAIALLFLVPVVLTIMASVRGIVPVSPMTLILSGLTVVGAVLAFVVWGMGYTMEQVMIALFPDPTLTNRTYLWDYSMSKVAERPWLGWGFQSFWGLGFESPAARAPVHFARVVNQAHNGYIDLLINLGIIGTALFAWLFLAFLSRLRKVGRYSSRLRFLIWVLFLLMLLNNVTESQFLRYNVPQWTMFIVTFFWVLYITLLLNPKYPVAAAPAPRAAEPVTVASSRRRG